MIRKEIGRIAYFIHLDRSAALSMILNYFTTYMEISGLTTLFDTYRAVGVARGGNGRAFTLLSLNFSLPSEPSSYLNCMY